MEISTLSIAPRFEIKDDRFDVANLASYELYIELSGDRLRFTVFNSINQTFIWLEDYHIYTPFKESQFVEGLKRVYKEHAFLSANFWKSITFSINSPYFTLVPSAYFTEENASKILDFAVGKSLSDSSEIIDYPHAKFEFVNVFSIDKSWFSWINDAYPSRKVTLVHTISTLIEGITREREFNGLHLYFEGIDISIIYFKDKKLQYCNRFQYRTTQDLLYYILFVINELNMPDDVKITFYGEITSFSENFLEISKYLQNLHFASTPNAIKFSMYFDEVPEHRYYSLFSGVHTE